MPRLAALIRLDRAPVDTSRLQPIVRSLSFDGERAEPARGADGPFAWASWSPASAAHASLALSRTDGGTLHVLLDGRLDNRADLLHELGIRTAEAAALSDAGLLARAFATWSDALFPRMAGSFALLLVDTLQGWVRLVRDPLGNKSLFFLRRGAALAVATRPAGLLGFDGSRVVFDDESIARYLASDGPRRGTSFFRDIEEVPPGGLVCFSEGVRHSSVGVPLRPEAFPSGWRGRDFEHRFLELLDDAVARRLDPARGNAVLMSGGLDSTAVAACAAHETAERGIPPPFTVSWIFDELPGIDESRWIAAANDACGARPLPIVGDESWPLSEETSWPRPRDSPVLGHLWRLHARSLALARDAGCTTLLNGEFGDQLWLGARDWLYDLVTAGRLDRATAGVLHAACLQARRIPTRPTLRHSLARWLRRRPAPQPAVRPWLTDWASQLVASRDATPTHGRPDPVAERMHDLLMPFDLQHVRAAERDAEPFGIDIRRPYRDQRLLEFFLGVPARWLYRPGENKPLLRRALAGRLPAEVVRRTEITSLLSLADRGLAERAWPRIRAVLESADAIWPRFVRPDWLWSRVDEMLGGSEDRGERIVIWDCYCLERWRATLDAPLASGAPNG